MGGDQGTMTFVFEAKKSGKTRLTIQKVYRGEYTNLAVFQVTVVAP